MSDVDEFHISHFILPFWPIWPILAWADWLVYNSLSGLREERKNTR